LKYVLEIIDEKTRQLFNEASTLESDCYIPIPQTGQHIELWGTTHPKGIALQVVASRYLYFNETPKRPVVKVQLICREVEP
jgi:hypothetical protein